MKFDDDQRHESKHTLIKTFPIVESYSIDSTIKKSLNNELIFVIAKGV